MAARNKKKKIFFFSRYISGPEHAVNSEQSLYYSSVQKITVTACFNFIGAAKAELEPASLDLLISVLLDDHQLSLPNSIPDHYFGLRFMLLLAIYVKTASGVFCNNLSFSCYRRSKSDSF